MKKTVVPRVAAVHDLSCVGRCSLTVIMPLLSAMGVQVCPLPTAVLSSHLGGFKEMAFCDFTEQMPSFYEHWKKEGILFDCIYSGFVASQQQMGVVQNFIDAFSANRPLVLVDPVMGDEGKLYSTYTPAMQEEMKVLVSKADVITPNYTEACFLLGETYDEATQEPQRMQEWLLRLAEFGPDKVVMTGIAMPEDVLLNMGYDKSTATHWQVSAKRIPVRYPGTGDAFASVLAGALLNGDDLPAAIERATDFVSLAVGITYAAGTPQREGILLEKALPFLYRKEAGQEEG